MKEQGCFAAEDSVWIGQSMSRDGGMKAFGWSRFKPNGSGHVEPAPEPHEPPIAEAATWVERLRIDFSQRTVYEMSEKVHVIESCCRA